MWDKDGTYNFRRELLDITEKFCEDYEERRGYKYLNEREHALVKYHTLCVLMDDLEMILGELENDPVYEGISPRRLYELKREAEKFHTVLDMLGETEEGDHVCGNCRHWLCDDMVVPRDTVAKCERMSVKKRFDSKPGRYMDKPR